MRARFKILVNGIAAATLLAGLSEAARAGITISTDATSNMTCSGGVCSPTAMDAVLNVGDLESLLAAGKVEVTTTGSGVEAQDIRVETALLWTNSTKLYLHAHRAAAIDGQMSVGGRSSLEIRAGKPSRHGGLMFGHGGNIAFEDLSANLTINGLNYTLVGSVKKLAKVIAAKPTGNFALAADYDAKPDGAYQASPIATVFSGNFEGLGHVIRNLRVKVATGTSDYVGMFSRLDPEGSIRDIGLEHLQMSVTAGGTGYLIGALVGESGNDQTGGGEVANSYAEGSISVGGSDSYIGGLVGFNEFGSKIMNSHSDCSIDANANGYKPFAGGLVGYNQGYISGSYATGNISAYNAGGLVAYNYGPSGDRNAGWISNAYATGDVSAENLLGGLIADNYGGNAGDHSGAVDSSYAMGSVGSGGGFIDTAEGENVYASDYWDTTTSGTYLACVTGSCLGVTPLTSKQLKSGLPQGFNPGIWAEDPGINGGFPYLLANPPPG